MNIVIISLLLLSADEQKKKVIDYDNLPIVIPYMSKWSNKEIVVLDVEQAGLANSKNFP
jgi:hypothetical protein